MHDAKRAAAADRSVLLQCPCTKARNVLYRVIKLMCISRMIGKIGNK